MSGVPGLSRFAIRGGGFSEGDVRLVDHELKNSRLIIDGNSLAWRLFDARERKGQDDVTSKELDNIEIQVREFFQPFLTNFVGIILVIRDEQSEPDSQDAATNVSGDNIQVGSQTPSDMVKIIRSVATEMKVQIESYNGSIYERAADLSRQHQSPIITDDGYFFRKAPEYGLIPWDSYKPTSRSCRIFRLDPKAQYNTELTEAKLGLINLLVGCLSLEDEDQQRVLRLMQNQLAFIVNVSECKRVEGKKWNDRLLAGVLSQLCVRSYEEAKGFVLSLVDESDRKTAEAIIHKGSYDLAFDQTARELRKAIEDICSCPNHYRVRVAQWTEWLHAQTRRPRKLLSALFRPLRIQLEGLDAEEDLSQTERKNILLKGLHSSVENFDHQLKRFPEAQDNLDNATVQEFFIVKLLMDAMDIENPERSPSSINNETLSCIIYYLGDSVDFLVDYREKLSEEIRHGCYKLRTPLSNLSACNQEILKHLETLIELIWTFNELNALAGYPMQQLRSEKWLNICLIYNLSVDEEFIGDEIPEAIKDELELVQKSSSEPNNAA